MFASGCCAGGAGSLVGMGGAFITIPALTSRWIALSQHQAQATSLASVFATGVGAATSCALAGAVNWPVVAALAGPGTIAANLGARLSSTLPGYTMKGLLGVFMVFTSGVVMAKPLLIQHNGGSDSSAPASTAEKFAKLCVIGCGVGVFSGLFGVGGGAITVPALTLSMPDMSHHEVIGTSCAAMVLPAVSGLCRHASTGALIPSAAVPLAMGTVIGSFFGGRYVALEMDENSLRNVFSGLLLVLGCATVRGGLALRRTALQV